MHHKHFHHFALTILTLSLLIIVSHHRSTRLPDFSLGSAGAWSEGFLHARWALTLPYVLCCPLCAHRTYLFSYTPSQPATFFLLTHPLSFSASANHHSSLIAGRPTFHILWTTIPWTVEAAESFWRHTSKESIWAGGRRMEKQSRKEKERTEWKGKERRRKRRGNKGRELSLPTWKLYFGLGRDIGNEILNE